MIPAHRLLAGPRGRRLLLGFAQISEQAVAGASSELPLSRAVFEAAYRMAERRGRRVSRITFGHAPGPRLGVDDVVTQLPKVRLVEPTDDMLMEALAASVESAMYWQEPDGEDILCSIPAVRVGLARVAEHLARSPLLDRWTQPMGRTDQRSLAWKEQRNRPTAVDLRKWREEALVSERAARKDRPGEIDAPVSGNWWSCPPSELRASTGSAPDGMPYGIRLVEDGLGWTEAEAARLRIDPDARVFEIGTADDWARLCREYPLDVTASRRHDWYRTTGRDGDWLVPDWCAVASDFEGVHLTIAGYLEAATIAIPVDDRWASVMAGCNPDTMWWLNDAAVSPFDSQPLVVG